MDTGETVETPPLELMMPVVLHTDDIRSRNLDALAETVYFLAEEQLALVMGHFYDMNARLCTAAGTATDAAGAPLNFETLFIAFAKVELRFDKDGAPLYPQLVTGPALFRAIQALPRLTEAQTKQWEDVIDGKRKEFFAKRRHRKLH